MLASTTTHSAFHPASRLRYSCYLTIVTLSFFLALCPAFGNTTDASPEKRASTEELLAQNRFHEALPAYEKLYTSLVQQFGQESQNSLIAAQGLAIVLTRLGNFEKARALAEATSAIQQRIMGTEDPQYLATQLLLAELNSYSGHHVEALAAGHTILSKFESQPGIPAPQIEDVRLTLAHMYMRKKEYEKGKDLCTESLKRLKESAETHQRTNLRANSLLAWALYCMKHFNTAQSIAEAVYQDSESNEELGLDVLRAIETLSYIAKEKKEYDKALELAQVMLEKETIVFGPEHPYTLNSLNWIASLYSLKKRRFKARAIYSQVLEIKERTLGPEHRETCAARQRLASASATCGEYDKAKELYEQVLEAQKRSLGPENKQTLLTMYRLAGVYSSLNNFSRAKELYEQVLEVEERTLEPGHNDTLATKQALATVCKPLAETCMQEGRYEEALNLYRIIHEASKAASANGAEDSSNILTQCALLRILGRYEEIWPLLENSMDATFAEQEGSPYKKLAPKALVEPKDERVLTVIGGQFIKLLTKYIPGYQFNASQYKRETNLSSFLQGKGDFCSTDVFAIQAVANKRQRSALRAVTANPGRILSLYTAPKSGIHDFADLRGKRVAIHDVDTILPLLTDLFQAAGMNINKDIHLVPCQDYRKAYDAIYSGLADATLLYYYPLFPDDAQRMALIISLPFEILPNVHKRHPGFFPYTFAPKSVPGLEKPLSVLVAPDVLLARASLPDTLVFAVAKTLHKYHTELKDMGYVGFATQDFYHPHDAYRICPVPLHPGATRYFNSLAMEQTQ